MRRFSGFRALLVCFLFLQLFHASADSSGYIVYLSDKGNQTFHPERFFHPNSLDKKAALGINPMATEEWPVNEFYLEQLGNLSDSVCGSSRWLNAVLLYTGDITGISSLPYVKSVEPILAGESASLLSTRAIHNSIPDDLIALQTGVMEDSVFSAAGISGKGIRIAVFDAGFFHADQFEGLSHLFKNAQIEMSMDFPARNKNVYNNDSHGTSVLTCIAGKSKGRNTGLAQAATFLLARTEYAKKEPLREEFFWLMAAEWADQHGADIISSSLGYAAERYFFRDMNGRKSIVTKAAGYAVRRGITVVNSAGNEGTDAWKYLITPADNDSVIAVGGLDPETGYVINFSSFGPGADGQLKPNVIAPAKVYAGNGRGWSVIHGTSFSCPLVTGFVACMMSYDTTLKHHPLRLMQRLHESAELYPYFDYAHGYGVPKASRFMKSLELKQELPFQAESSNFRADIAEASDEKSGTNRTVRVNVHLPVNKSVLPDGWNPLLYLSAFNERGKMLNYQVCRLLPKDIGKETEMYFSVPAATNSIRFHYLGSTLNKSLR
jgi:serine protease AprX